jgi:Fur family ferric uptake transcriptional regulator
MTARRDTIRQALTAAGTFISAQDLHARLRAAGHRTGLTTVFRTLQALAQDGDADALRAAGGQHVYRACRSREHHHHLLCRICGNAAEVSSLAVESWVATVGGQHGFADVTHTVEVFGTCPDCAASRPSRPGTGRRQALPG